MRIPVALLVIAAVLCGCCPCPAGYPEPTPRAFTRGQVEVKQPRTGLRPSRQQHGTILTIQNEFVHGFWDSDQIQIKPTLDGDKCYWWGEVRIRDAEFGSAGRTPAGAAQGLHVDHIQVLGTEKAGAINFIFENVIFSMRGDVPPPDLTPADTLLLQELRAGVVALRGVWVDPSLQAIKVTLRTPWSRLDSLWIEDSPGLRVHITALKPEQIGRITVRNSPGARVTAADGLKLTVVEEIDPLAVEVAALKGEVRAARAEAERANARLGKIAEAFR